VQCRLERMPIKQMILDFMARVGNVDGNAAAGYVSRVVVGGVGGLVGFHMSYTQAGGGIAGVAMSSIVVPVFLIVGTTLGSSFTTTGLVIAAGAVHYIAFRKRGVRPSEQRVDSEQVDPLQA